MIEPGDDSAAVVRRIRKFAFYGWIAFLVPSFWTGGWMGLVGLTCSAAVAMINFLWLEDIVCKVLQPTPHVSAWRLAFRVMARFALFCVALSAAIIVARFNVISVLLGFSIIVVGIMGEAVYSAFRAGAGNGPADGAD